MGTISKQSVYRVTHFFKPQLGAFMKLEKKKYFCPFHSEQTPSLLVYVKTKKYHCFGCGRHGDVTGAVLDELKFHNKELQ